MADEEKKGRGENKDEGTKEEKSVSLYGFKIGCQLPISELLINLFFFLPRNIDK